MFVGNVLPSAYTSSLFSILFTSSAIISGVIPFVLPKFSPIKLFTAKSTNSSTLACSVASFEFLACAIIPFSPVNIDILTAANINNTTIVTTNAISVIPFSLFFIFLLLSLLFSLMNLIKDIFFT